MKSITRILFVGMCLSGCEAKAPVAELDYLGFYAEGRTYHLRFAADQPILELFSMNKHQRIVLAQMRCSLGVDRNLNFEHYLKHYATGGLKFIELRDSKHKLRYVHDADLRFWASGPAELQGDESLAKEELDVLLKDKDTIPCKVRMTVNFSSPYYSKTMLVPTKDILAVVKPRYAP